MATKIYKQKVILVHGIDDTSRVFVRMKQELEKKGFTVYMIDFVPNDGSALLQDLAKQLAEFVERNIGHEEKFDLIGFSMGGIVARYYVQKMNGGRYVRKFVTISSPHHGTAVAALSHKPGAMQMRIGSDFLHELNKDLKELDKVDFTSIWSPLDLMIVPANSSKMSIGKDIVISVVAHPLMVSDKRVISFLQDLLLDQN